MGNSEKDNKYKMPFSEAELLSGLNECNSHADELEPKSNDVT